MNTDILKKLMAFLLATLTPLVSLMRYGGIADKAKFNGDDYSVMRIDLSVKPDGLDEKFDYLYDLATLDDSLDYAAHPDSVLLKNGSILTLYPAGHGKGAVLSKLSFDGGKSWSHSLENTPESWKNSRETPTVYRLEFSDGKTGDKLIMISANPKWPREKTTGGFNCSLSSDEGETWSQFELFYPKNADGGVVPIVAMSSLTRLKENGRFVDKWMGLFHDAEFYNYKTILTFDKDGKMHWSKPEKYFSAYRDIEKETNMCEVEVIRSDEGMGDELCLITRSNSKKQNSLLSFSSDEGKTWSEPVFAPAVLNGERHKADYTPDGRLFITFRSIERGRRAAENSPIENRSGWMSEGWVAWVGTYADLKNGTQGQYRLKLAHTYLKMQNSKEYAANADTGYCGNVVLADGTIVTTSYGCFDNTKITKKLEFKTYIASKRINLSDIDELAKALKEERESARVTVC